MEKNKKSKKQITKDSSKLRKPFLGLDTSEIEGKQNQEEIDQIFNLVPDMIAVASADGYFKKLNTVWEDVLGFTIEELLSKPFYDFIHPDDIESTIQELKRQVDKEVTLNFVNRYRCKNGSYKWLEWVYRPDKNKTQLLVVARDITERTQAEQVLKESEEKFRAIFDNAADGIALADVSVMKFHSCNKMFSDMLGYSEEEIKNIGVEDIHPQEHLPHIIEQFKKLANKETIITTDIPVLRKDGSIFFADIHAMPITLSGENYLIGIFRNITERKQAAEKILRLNTNLSATLHAIPDLLFELDENGMYLDIWAKTPELLAREKEILLGHTVTEMLPPDAATAVMASLSEAKANGESFGKVIRLDLPDGTRWFELSTAKKDMANATVNRFITLSRDITDRKLAEEALLKEKTFSETMINSLPGIFYLFDENGRFIRWNRNLEMVTGYSAEEIEQMTSLDFISGEGKPLVGEVIQEVLLEGKASVEANLITKDGRSIPYHFTGVRLLWNNRPYLSGMAIDITERKQAEQALKESEEKFRIIFNNAADGIVLTNIDNKKFHAVNKMFIDMLGYSDEEINNLGVADIHPKEDLPYIIEQFNKLIREETIVNTDIPVKRKDGTIFYADIHAMPTKLSGKNYLIGIFRDISERKQAEMELLREKQFTEKLLESLPGIFFLYDSTCHLKRWNKAHETAMGFAADELRDWYIPDWHETPEEAAAGMAFVKSVLETGVGGAFETTLINKEGRFVPYLISITRLMTPDGPFMMGVGIDITERKKAEEALRISEEKYRLVVENANDAIMIVQNGMVKFPNRQTKMLSGYTEEELIRVPFVHFVHPDDRDMVIDTHRRRIQGQDVPTRYIFRIITKPGDMIWVEASAVLVAWEGQPATLSFLRDITLQKKLEEQLLQSQKMEAVGTLAGGIAHDFNNLLMGILGYTSLMLLKSEKTHPFYEKLKTIESLVESGSDLTKQLLGFARGGKYEVKSVDVNTLIIKTSEIFERTKKEITIHKKLQEDLSAVEADAGQIEQVLLNLYVNAWQAMPSGGNLFLETQNAELNEMQSSTLNVKLRNYVKISVTDTGVGMDTETQKRIFEPFFSTKGIGKGTGLGLASAYGIIKNHGGVINVYSEKGHGTTFTIYLPASGVKTAEVKTSEGNLVTGHETILIVDDEPINTETIKELLETLGYRVKTAQSGKEAIELYREHGKGIQLVILDMIMPEMNGKETLEKLMEIDRNVSVLLSSGYSINGEAKSILALGCKGFIQKPFRVEELSQKIREELDG